MHYADKLLTPSSKKGRDWTRKGVARGRELTIDLRRRVVDAIEQGLSCRQAAERFGVSASSAIRWFTQLKKQGDVAAKRQGGDRKSGRIEAEAGFLLGEVAKTPDATLVELQGKLKVRGVSVGVGTLWRFSHRRNHTAV